MKYYLPCRPDSWLARLAEGWAFAATEHPLPVVDFLPWNGDGWPVVLLVRTVPVENVEAGVARTLVRARELGVPDASMRRFVLWLRAPERGLISDDEAQSLIDRFELRGA